MFDRVRAIPWVLLLVGAAHARGAEPSAEPSTSAASGPRPNIIFIMADDLGHADLGCYGQQKVLTPHIDRMAREGIRFTQVYCGTSVCAPSRCILMTGLHAGHAHIRANRGSEPEGELPLPAGSLTIARLLKQAGYRTACIGKWGLGSSTSSGAPNRQGFDSFFGYTGHGQAHEYYPDHLWRNGQRVELDGKTYSHDLFVEEALRWVRDNREKPFFLYLPLTIPHAKLQVPDLGPYADKNWPAPARAMAAMITRMDQGIGRLLDLLEDLEIDERTIVFFTSDNGPDRGGVRQFLDSSASLRGAKRSMYEGGLRVPMVVRWPGRVPADKVSDEVWAFYDVLPTCAELAGATLPPEATGDGISVVPALLGRPLPAREYLYWEIHEPISSQAVRMGDWKAVRPAFDAPIELYHLKSDPTESADRAADEPAILRKAQELLKTARADSPLWPIKLPRREAAKPDAPANTRPAR